MVHVIFRRGVFHWESPEIQALDSSISAFQHEKVLEYLGLTGRENIFITSVDIKKPIMIVEEAKEERPPKGVTVLDIGEIRTVGYKRELLVYDVQFMCDIGDVFYNIVFSIGMIITPNIKSVESVSIALLQKIPSDIKSGVDVTYEEYLVYGKKPKLVLR